MITSDTEPARRQGLRVLCLGPFRVFRGPEEIQDEDWGQGKGPTRKVKAMFAYLLSRRERGARKETLVDLLWPEQTNYDRASGCFHVTLHYLRRALEPDLESGAESSYIRYEGERYLFGPLEPSWIDADVFETCCRRAQECDRGGDSEAAVLHWGMARDLYGGDYMTGIHTRKPKSILRGIMYHCARLRSPVYPLFGFLTSW